MSLIHLVSLERSATVGGRQPLLCVTIIQGCYQLMSLKYLQHVRTSGSEKNHLYHCGN